MKLKQIRLVIAIVLLLSLTLCFVGCDSFTYFDSDKKLKIKKDVEITIVDGERQYTETVTEGETPTIEALYKPGYYLDGFYDESGTKYFDSLGKSTVQWGSNCPSKFYAKWEDIANLSDSWSGNDGKFYDFSWKDVFHFTIGNDNIIKFKNAIMGNQGSKFQLDLYFYAYDETFVSEQASDSLKVMWLQTNDASTYLTYETIYPSTNSKQYNVKLSVGVSEISLDTIYFGFNRGNNFKHGHVKFTKYELRII